MAEPPEMRHIPANGGIPLAVHHDRFLIKTDATATDGELLILETTVIPQTGAGIHRHPAREVFYVLEGSFDFYTVRDNRRVIMRAEVGATIVVPPDVPHGYTNVAALPGRMLCVFSPAQPIQAFFEGIDEMLTRRPEPLTMDSPEYQEGSRRVAEQHQLTRVVVSGD
jgi:quercetin dioxygenase-like cupin family protein